MGNKRFILSVILLLGIGLTGIQVQAQTNTNKRTSGSIHQAVIAGDLNKMKALLEADSILLELKDMHGNTPLNLACFIPETWNKQPAIAKFLINKGANVNTKNKEGITPLLGICSGAGPDFAIVQQLIAKGADINEQDNNGRIPLLDVVIVGNLEVTKFMIEHGADINAYDKIYSNDVLNLAISFNKNDTIAKLLIESGAKLNQKDPDGNTEIHLAAMRGFSNLIRLLVEKGADIYAVNKNNHTALYYAAKHGYRLAADALIAAGADESIIAEKNYGKATQLTATLKQGEAYIWYVNGGNVVKTKKHLLLLNPQIFDESTEAGLANGCLNPNELAGHKITVFTDYPNRNRSKLRVLTMAKQMPEIDWVFTSSDSKVDSLDISSYRLIGINDSLSVGGVQVRTVPGVLGNASVAYYIKADGIKIFNGRDHVCSNKVSEVEQYHREIDSLKQFGSIDIAFLRVRGHFDNDYEPYLYLLDQLLPKTIYLTGGEGMVSEYPKCAEFLQIRNIPIKYPEGRIAGDRFHYLRK
jgi:ankyrin repeat protein